MAECKVDDCPLKSVGQGLCDKHYARLRRHGDPLRFKSTQSDHERLANTRIITLPNGCEIAPDLPPTGHGYAQITFGGKSNQPLHKVRYELLVGPVPEGLVLDHTCHTNDASCPGGDSCPHRACVNVAHLEPVTPEENSRRGAPQRRTHCPRGHAYDEANTYITKQGTRFCRTCNRERMRKQRP